ncbi:hypothetical protein T12_4189 [Trichinella patagoniensis]|uniref:Uncharacterized protein n=1 Tax=Trichinella patagoniensis TaxID=990121 RepID=A0A0V1AG93_9BILA|nr:hypothetical protein T12_4189 [Trichinella patagoniensis]
MRRWPPPRPCQINSNSKLCRSAFATLRYIPASNRARDKKTEEGNLERLAEVLHRLQSIGLKIRSTNAPQCVIHGTQCRYRATALDTESETERQDKGIFSQAVQVW